MREEREVLIIWLICAPNKSFTWTFIYIHIIWFFRKLEYTSSSSWSRISNIPTYPKKQQTRTNTRGPKLLYCLHFKDLILAIPRHIIAILPSLKQGNLNECGSLVHLYPGYKQRKMKNCNRCSCNRVKLVQAWRTHLMVEDDKTQASESVLMF